MSWSSSDPDAWIPNLRYSRLQRVNSACLQRREGAPVSRLRPVAVLTTSSCASPRVQFTLMQAAFPGCWYSALLSPAARKNSALSEACCPRAVQTVLLHGNVMTSEGIFMWRINTALSFKKQTEGGKENEGRPAARGRTTVLVVDVAVGACVCARHALCGFPTVWVRARERRMGGSCSFRCLALFLAVHIVSVLQTVLVSAGQCDSVFKGFSDCLIQLGDNMANYPQDLDDRENLQKICSYWDDFHSCATTALADCHEGATDLWDKLKKESRSLNFRGSLFELCGGGNGAPRSADARGVALVLTTLPTILTWLAF